MRFPTLASVAGIGRALLVVMAAGLACVFYGALVERRWYRRREYRLDVLPSDATTPVTVLHLSDLHMVRGDRAKARFLASLPAADVTVVTGDFLGEPEAVEREELAVLQTYLPAALTDEEVDALLDEAIEETGAIGPGDVGKVMSAVMAAAKGRADGRAVQARVRSRLGA